VKDLAERFGYSLAGIWVLMQRRSRTTWLGGPSTYQCTRDACGALLTEDDHAMAGHRSLGDAERARRNLIKAGQG
jgi:hypothetical protein